MNWEIDEIRKGNIYEFRIFIAEKKKLKNTKHAKKYDKQTLC